MPNEADSNSAVMDTEVYDDGASEVQILFTIIDTVFTNNCYICFFLISGTLLLSVH